MNHLCTLFYHRYLPFLNRNILFCRKHENYSCIFVKFVVFRSIVYFLSMLHFLTWLFHKKTDNFSALYKFFNGKSVPQPSHSPYNDYNRTADHHRIFLSNPDYYLNNTVHRIQRKYVPVCPVLHFRLMPVQAYYTPFIPQAKRDIKLEQFLSKRCTPL